MSKKNSNFRKMIKYYKPYKRTFIFDMLFAGISAAIALIIPLVVRYVTNTMIYFDGAEIRRQLVWIAAFLFLLLVIDLYAKYYIANYGHVMGAKIEYGMREEIFAHMQKLSFTFFDNAKVGQLMSRITTDLFDITELLHHGPENIILSVLKIAGALIILCRINWQLSVAAFVVLPFMFYYVKVLNHKMRLAFRENRVQIANINGQIEENLAGIRVVKSFGNEEIEMKKFKTGNDAFLRAKKNNYLYMGAFQSGTGVMTTLITVNVIVVGGVLISYGKINLSDYITFLMYIGVFTEPIRTLVNFTEQFQSGFTGFERFQEIMAIQPDIEDKPDAVELQDVKGEIRFDQVSFRYEDGVDTVLEKVDLEVPAGQYIALVGPSGVGKTTLCSLIPRFYEVTDGEIYIDGVNIKDVTLKSLRSHIGIVQQDVYLFGGTIYENIAYGKPDATEEEIIEAAKNANAHDFIMSFPNGYQTDIGQRGIKLSGGQKQRLSIARVFLKNPEILIFDEATSALDNESERVVQESLENLARNRTTFVIAHRLTTIQNAERILVLTEEGITESGTHDELLEKGGVYEKLYHMHY